MNLIYIYYCSKVMTVLWIALLTAIVGGKR